MNGHLFSNRATGWIGFFLFGLALLVGLPLLGQEQEQESLGDAARRIRAERTTFTRPEEGTMRPVVPCEPCEYTHHAGELLQEENFDELDRLANLARSTKARWQGGGWKIHSLYQGIEWLVGSKNPDQLWLAHIEKLKRWKAHNPNSITASVALAKAYANYAWKARGNEYAYKVRSKQWKPFNERMQIAKEVLVGASTQPAKCPEYYYVLLQVSAAQGWDRATADAIFEKGIALEPDYHYLYHEMASYLLPRWYGQSLDDIAQFADRIAKRFSGADGTIDGAILYFRIAEHISPIEGQPMIQRMSWPLIEQGHRNLVARYGNTDHIRNIMAMMSFQAGEYELSVKLFDEIGDHWEGQGVWETRENFDQTRAWAKQFTTPEQAMLMAIHRDTSTPEGRVYLEEINRYFARTHTVPLQDCIRAGAGEVQVFSLALQLDENGKVLKSAALPNSAARDRCATLLIGGAQFSKPPKSPFWVIVGVDKE